MDNSQPIYQPLEVSAIPFFPMPLTIPIFVPTHAWQYQSIITAVPIQQSQDGVIRIMGSGLLQNHDLQNNHNRNFGRGASDQHVNTYHNGQRQGYRGRGGGNSYNRIQPEQSWVMPPKNVWQPDQQTQAMPSYQPKKKQQKQVMSKPDAPLAANQMAPPKTNVNLDSLVDEIAADILFEKSKQTQKKKKTTVQFITNLKTTATQQSETYDKAAQDIIQEEESKIYSSPPDFESQHLNIKEELKVEPEWSSKPSNPWEMPLNFNGKPKSAPAKANSKKPKSEVVTSTPLKEEQKLSMKAEPVPPQVEKKPTSQLPPSKPDLHVKKQQLNDEHEMHALIEQSDEFKMWKNIPKAQRDRLTKKQLMRVMKPDILAEGLALEVNHQRTHAKKVVVQNEEAENTSTPKIQKKSESRPAQVTSATQIQSKPFKEPALQSLQVPQHARQHHQQMNISPIQPDNFKLKSKPKKIVVEERNEFNEIVRQIVEKAKKRKVTAVKKAILKMREKTQRRTDHKSVNPQKKPQIHEDGLSSGYVTIDEGQEDAGQMKKQVSNKVTNAPSDVIVTLGQQYPLKQTKGLPYTAVFSNFSKTVEEVEADFLKKYDKTKEDDQILGKEKSYVRFMNIDEDEEEQEIVDDQDENSAFSSSKKLLLHPKKSIREYVDVIQNADLEQTVFNLIQKLKKLYFNRKMNPTKKGKGAQRNLKKRYIIGMKEVVKHLNAENLKMIIMAVNLERVEGENGLDGMTYDVIQACRDQKIPLVFCLTRYKLGYVSKFQGQKASILGIFNFQGANEEFSQLQQRTNDLRNQFYDQLSQNLDDYQLKLLRKENRYLDWQLFDRLKGDTFFY